MFLHCLCFIWPFCECSVFHHNNTIVENVRDFADSASVKTWKAEKDLQNLPSESALPSSTSIYHHISNWSQPKHPLCSEEYWNNCQCHNSLSRLLFLLMFFFVVVILVLFVFVIILFLVPFLAESSKNKLKKHSIHNIWSFDTETPLFCLSLLKCEILYKSDVCLGFYRDLVGLQ